MTYHIPREYQWNYDGDYLPQSYDLQHFDDADEAPTNVEMAEYSAAKREQREDAACVQTFIDNFEAFLGELKSWAQR